MKTVGLFYDPDDLEIPAKSSEFESIQDVIDSAECAPGEGLKILVQPLIGLEDMEFSKGAESERRDYLLRTNIAFIETYKPDSRSGAIIKRLIALLCRIGGLTVDFISYGLGGDRLPWVFKCLECGRNFYDSVSLCNEDIIVCKHCDARHLSGNNGYHAWIIKESGKS